MELIHTCTASRISSGRSPSTRRSGSRAHGRCC